VHVPLTGHVVGNFDVIVPQEQRLKMPVNAVLLLKDNTPADAMAIIESAFSTYHYPGDGDLLDYASRKLAANPTVKDDMFSVQFTFSLEKGQVIPHEDEKLAILALYEDRASGTIRPGPSAPEEPLGKGGYFDKHLIIARLLRSENVPGIPQRAHDTSHEVENPVKPI
jgi:hypothetical protein